MCCKMILLNPKPHPFHLPPNYKVAYPGEPVESTTYWIFKIEELGTISDALRLCA